MQQASTSDTSVRGRRIDPGVVAVLLLGGYLLVSIVWRFLFFDATGSAVDINNVAFLPLYLAATIFAVLVARESRLDPRTRRAWLLIAAANFANWIGDLLWT